MRGIVIGGMVIGLLLGCNNGEIEKLEKKNSFFDSVIKIGHEFQGIFGVFGDAIGNALGFNVVKSDSKKSEVGAHFNKIKQGLENTKTKLGELSGKISATKNANTKGVEAVISSAGEVITKLIESVTKLSEVTAKGGATPIGDAETSATAAVVAPVDDVNIVIREVGEIIKTANEAGVDVGKGNDGGQAVANASGAGAPAAIVGKNGTQADAKAGPLLAEQVSKADPLAMINKIGNANTGATLNQGNTNEAGALATKVASSSGNNIGAKTTADLAAAVALKAMTQGGKFSANNASEEAGAVKAAAANAVNKVLGVLDEIIRRIVNINLEKVGKAVKGIQYSENTGTNTTEASTSNK